MAGDSWLQQLRVNSKAAAPLLPALTCTHQQHLDPHLCIRQLAGCRNNATLNAAAPPTCITLHCSPSVRTQAATSWETAAPCPAGVNLTISFDAQGKPWAWDSTKNSSCAVRQAPSPVTFATAPRCTAQPTANTSSADAQGNLW